MVEIIGQLGEGEIIGDAAHAGHTPRLGNRLEGSQQQFAGVFLEIGAVVRIAQYRQAGSHAFKIIGDDIKMLGGV